MKKHLRLISMALVVVPLLVAAIPGKAPAQAYSFAKIADSANGFDPFEFGCPAINEQGDVAFRATRESGETTVFRTSQLRVLVVATESQGFGFMGRHPSINDRGDVSFAANLDSGGEAILRGNGGPLTTIAQTDPGPFNFFGFDTSVNDSGEVAFKAELDDFDEGLFSGSGGEITTHYLASNSQFGGDDSGPSINDLGRIAFPEFLDAGPSGIFLTTGRDVFIRIVDDRGPFDFTENPSLNEQALVGFHAFRDDGSEAIITGKGGPLRVVADTSGPFGSFGFDGPSLNDQGGVAFPASLDTGEQGIFVGPDPVADRVIGTGDELDGSRVSNLVSCREALNNRGQVTFLADLEDGRTTVFRATPSA